jgi:hypothetical protein
MTIYYNNVIFEQKHTIMNTDILKLYKQLDDMEQSKEIVLLKNQIKETLYQNLRGHFLELTSIGRVIGFDELQKELKAAMDLIELQKNK